MARVLLITAFLTAAIGVGLVVFVVLGSGRGPDYEWRLHNDTAADASAQGVDLNSGKVLKTIRVAAGNTARLPWPQTALGDVYRVQDGAGRALGCFTIRQIITTHKPPVRITLQLSQARPCTEQTQNAAGAAPATEPRKTIRKGRDDDIIDATGRRRPADLRRAF